MSQPITLQEIANIKAELQQQGINLSDSQIRQELERRRTAERTQAQPQTFEAGKDIPEPDRGLIATGAENVFDAVGSALWSATDVATFGLAGVAAEKAMGKQAYNSMLEELNDTLGGRAGGAVGGLVGFAAPMGVASKLTNALLRTARGARQLKAIKAGKTIATPTTATLQRQAANKLYEETQRQVKNGIGIGLTEKEALRVTKDITDKTIGFTQSGSWFKQLPFVKPYVKGPAYRMENDINFVNQVRSAMQKSTPQRLANELAKRNITLPTNRLNALSDDMVNLVGKQPFNSIERVISSKYGEGLTGAAMKLLGSGMQEASDFMIAGTAMDYIQHRAGNLDLHEKSLAERALTHGLIGFGFGTFRYAKGPRAIFGQGGKTEPIYKDAYKAMGLYAANIKKKIKGMGFEETKALARLEVERGTTGLFVNGVRMQPKDLMPRKGITAKDKNALKEGLYKHFDRQGAYIRKNFGAESIKDLWQSIPRMALGSWLFHHDPISTGDWKKMGPGDLWFNVLLGAVVTKRGKTLYSSKGIEKTFGAEKILEFEQKPRHYNSEVTESVRGLERMGINADHITDTFQQLKGDRDTDLAAKSRIEAIDKIAEVLEAHDIIYDRTSNEGRPVIPESDATIFSLQNRELNNLLVPVNKYLTVRNYVTNPNAKPENMQRALDAIINTRSEALSTENQTINFDSRRNIENSIRQEMSLTWDKIGDAIFQNFKQQMGLLTGEPDWVSAEGRMHKWFDREGNWNPDGELAINKLIHIQDKLQKRNQISITDLQTIEGQGRQVNITQEKVDRITELQNRLEKELGEEFYGAKTGEIIDLLSDESMWSSLHTNDFHKNVVRTTDIIAGKEVNGVDSQKIQNVTNLIERIFTHENNPNKKEIVSNVRKIKVDWEDSIHGKTINEQQKIINFLSDMFLITTTNGKKPLDNREVTVKANDIIGLMESLKELGMPDPQLHGLNPRMRVWVDQAVTYGMEKVLSRLDVNKYEAASIKKLMLSGLAKQVEEGNRITGLQIPDKLTIDQVKNMLGESVSSETAREYIEAYDRVINQLSFGEDAILTKNKSYIYEGLSESQLSTILTVDHILQNNKISKDIQKELDSIQLAGTKISEEISILEEKIKEPDTDNVAQIQVVLDSKRAALDEVDIFRQQFVDALTGHEEISRASAHIYWYKEYRDQSGKTIKDLLQEQAQISDPTDFRNRTQEIRDAAIAIAEKVNERADINTSHNERINESVRILKQQEVEGIMPKDKTNIDPQGFIDKYNKTIADINNDGQVYSTASEAFHKLYEETVGKGNIDRFKDNIFDLAGTTKLKASDEVRNEVQNLVNLNESRFNIKQLTMKLDGEGSGVFKSSQMSKGFLTDLYTEVFGLSGTTDMIVLSNKYFENNVFGTTFRNPEKFQQISSKLQSDDFRATESNAAENVLKHSQDGVARGVMTKEGEHFGTLPTERILVQGAHIPIVIDENLTIAIPASKRSFNSLADSFIRWYDANVNSQYVKNARKKLPQADALFNQLGEYRKYLKESKEKGSTSYDINIFRDKGSFDRDFLENSIANMFNVMYGQKIDGDFLQAAYLNQKTTRKTYKYLRLAQNQGYTRNSRIKADILKSVYAESDNSYHRELIDRYADKQERYMFNIEDGRNSVTGEQFANMLITDNRSVTEAMIEKRYQDNIITEEVYKEQMETIRAAHSINAEQTNGMSALRREALDYELLANGQANLIGVSSGAKPVGLTSWTDSQGRIHVLNNKTHYFYDSRLDPFFEKNPNIDMISFTSGTKKAKIIDPTTEDLVNLHKPYGSAGSRTQDLIPKFEGDKKEIVTNIVDFINKIEGIDITNEAVFPLRNEQSLTGTIYGKPKDAKVLKQLANWTSKESRIDLYEYARADMATRFLNETTQLYNIDNTKRASEEALSFIKSNKNQDGMLTTEVDNPSFAALWMEGNGVPFSVVSKQLYDRFIQSRYIDKTGVMDGYTDAGGTPIVRSNLSLDLQVPVYSRALGEGKKGVQIFLGEAKVTSDYLDRPIHFAGELGASVKAKAGIVSRDKYRDKGSISLVLTHTGKEKDNRDVIVDIKRNQIKDPLRPDAKLTDSRYKEIVDYIQKIKKQVADGDLVKWIDVHNQLKIDNFTGKDKFNAALGIMVLPSPRTGPQDAMVVRMKDILPSKDGGLIELNSWDVTMRAQRDFDTDKLTFYMDNPFSVVKEAYEKNIRVLEPLPDVKEPMSLDLYDNQSKVNYTNALGELKVARGPVVKEQRKLSYMESLFNEIGSIDFGKIDGIKVEAVLAKDLMPSLQRLTTDAQGVLDVYDGFPGQFRDMQTWQRNSRYGNGKVTNRQAIDLKESEPFFQLRLTEEGKESQRSILDKESYEIIIDKIMSDYGRLLNLESNLWEAGETKKPRYEDMVSEYKDFRDTYRADRVNRIFYEHLKRKTSKEVADQIFKVEKGEITQPILSKIAEKIRENDDPFLKTLRTIATRDHTRVNELMSPSYGYFNKSVDKLIGRDRAEMLLLLQYEGSPKLTEGQEGERVRLLDELWSGVSEGRSVEELHTQANYLQEQMKRTEWSLSREEKKDSRQRDESWIEEKKEELFIKARALSSIADRVGMKQGFGQEFQSYRKNRNNVIKADWRKDIIIRNSKTGEFVKTLKKGSGDKHELNRFQTAVINPVIFKPIVENEAIDATAFAYSTMGYFSHISEGDKRNFGKIIRQTKSNIKKEVKNTLNEKGYNDWAAYSLRTYEQVIKGLRQVHELANQGAIKEDGIQNWMGTLPSGKETYGLDFLVGLLTPDYSSNMNEYHYSPRTGALLPAVEAPKKSLISASLRAMQEYGVHSDFKGFVKDLASVHRGFYDAIVAGRSFPEALRRIEETSFEGALTSHTIKKAYNDPFVPFSEYKSLKDTFDKTPALTSELAEVGRMIVQDGALIDPYSAHKFRRQVIEEAGEDAYKNLWRKSRGRVLFDGLNTRQFGNRTGEGQLVGELIMTRSEVENRFLIGKERRQAAKKAEIEDHVNKVIGAANELNSKTGEIDC